MKADLCRAWIIISGVLLFAQNELSAQPDFSALGTDFNDRTLKLFARGTYVKPGSDKVYGGFTLNGSLSMDSEEKGGIRARYENPTLGDLLFLLVRLINGESTTTESGLSHAYGSGFIGWMQFYKNVVDGDRFLLSPGFSFADYIFGIEQIDSIRGRAMYDPAGYFFAAGPCVMASYLIGRTGMWVDGYVNYDLSFGKVNYSRAGYTPVTGYPKPHFITYGADLNHRSGLFFGVRFNQVIDRGDTRVHALRTDLSLGFHFKSFD